MANRYRVTAYKIYITKQGDTFDKLALDLYNDETMSSEIIKFNPDYANTIVFHAFAKIRLPILEKLENVETLPPWRSGGTL